MYGLETGREVRKDRGGSEGRRKEVRERVEMEGRREGGWKEREGGKGGEGGRKERKGGRVRRDEHIQHLYGQDMPQQLQSMAEPFSAGCALQRALQSAACERRGLC